jgi:osmoprotectant transport system permease protein
LNADEQKIYNYVQQQFQKIYNLEWLQPVGFNNSYALMMRKEQSKKTGIYTISNLVNYLKEKE